jgi:hypothetical protein
MSDGVENNGRTTKPGGVTGKGFVKGKSGNPGGRKPIPEDVKEMCRALSPKAVQALGVALEEGGAVSVQAARVLLDRAWGTPAQTVTIEDEASKLTTEELRRRCAALLAHSEKRDD